MWDWHGGWGWFGAMHLLWWAVVVAGLAVLWRSVAGRRGGGEREDHALAILRERYARGEIDQAEYDQRVRHLQGSA
jgi:putative membrane protein